MKKKILTLVMTAMLVVSGVCGMEMSVSAANTEDKPYSMDSRNATGTTSWRDKNNTTKVYVNPQSGPLLSYQVQGRKDGGAKMNCSSLVRIPNGVQGSITNSVRENGKNEARLYLKSTVYAQAWTKGVWSPDSTRNYTIYN